MITGTPITLFNFANEITYSKFLPRYKNLRFALSEGGIGWIPYFLERADYVYKHHHAWTHNEFGGRLPSDLFREHVVTCFIDDAAGVRNRDLIGVDTLTWECDYPHSDSTWPRSPEVLWESVKDVPKAEIDAMTHLNAMRHFRFDPFKHVPREQATVAALRAQAKHVDVKPTAGKGGKRPVRLQERLLHDRRHHAADGGCVRGGVPRRPGRRQRRRPPHDDGAFRRSAGGAALRLRGRLALALCASLAAAACGKPGADDPVIARLGEQAIRRSEVSAPAAFRLYVHEAQSYAVLEEETRRIVNERLLAEAASREGIAPAALLARVEADAPAVPDGDVERYLAEHPETTSPSADSRARVRRYLEERARIEHRLAFLAGLRERAGFEWLLAKPVPPRVALAAPGAPARGPAAAPVTIVHLASFGSAESARSADKLAHLAEELPGRFRWLHVNQVRDGDEAGLRGAELAFLAQDAGRFWEAHDALFAHGGRLDAAALARAARAAGLADDALERADPDALRRRVEADLALARQSGSLREPTLFVNGRYWSGLGSYAELRALVQEELTLAESAGTR